MRSKNSIKSKLLALCVCFFTISAFAQKQNAIHPGQVWLDTSGKPIQAHGFSVFYKDGTYYWYGENKEFTKSGSNIWTYGIRCYTSKDLYNWEDKGLIIPPDTENPLSSLHPSQQYDRPHIIFNPKTKKYVAWIKVMGSSQSMTILTADDFMGPYTKIKEGYRPNGFESGDFDLYMDEKTGKGYIWAERPHYEMICSTLNDDFTSVTSEFSNHFIGILPPDTREAPTHFVRKGKHYIFTSGTMSYYPNPTLVSTFTDYHGEYIDLGNPHPKDTTNTSYCSQITDVIKIPGKKDLYVAVADRWMPKSCGRGLYERLHPIMKDMFKDSKPQERNFDQVKMQDKTGEKRSALDATQNARYVWLPIVWENDFPKIYWHDEWKLEDYK